MVNGVDPSATDEVLAGAAQAGCVASFEQLARRVQGPLVRFLSRRFPSRRDAEDVAQEALLRAYRSLGKYDGRRRFRAWVFAIAYRVAVDWGRREGRAADPLDEGVAGTTAADPARVVAEREARQRLWAVAREVLTEEQVTALWLYYVEEMSAGEVARVMGRSWVSVKTMLHRARKRLEPHVGERELQVRPVLAGGVK